MFVECAMAEGEEETTWILAGVALFLALKY